ncbi:inactive serine protease 45-like [Gigantopelta aegis]|uniref:inactive serine protease 45-like n=1 Tax=Gigantopelta aegis TaxID=1735272 RepID=UPI001B88D081|nr:inactive serine protease 45-like [Gigantopelta aegis]
MVGVLFLLFLNLVLLDSLKRSKRLRTTYAKFLGPEVCDAIYKYARNNFLPTNTACVESINKRDNPCLYDHGGMVVCSRNGRWILHGIITLPSCFDQLPSLVIDITSQAIQDFIKKA